MKITIPNRVLIGHRSKNNRYYSRKALESCIGRFEGKKVFLNHPEEGKRRNFEDLIGTAHNLHYSPQGLRGDLELDGTHEQVKRIAELYEQKMPLGGISANLDYVLGTANGQTWVVAIDDITSWDYVAEPATTDILESEEPAVDEKIEEVIENILTKADFDKLANEFAELQTRLNVLEAVKADNNSIKVAPQAPIYKTNKNNI